MKDKDQIGMFIVKIFIVLFGIVMFFGGGIRGLQAPAFEEQKSFILHEFKNVEAIDAIKFNGKYEVVYRKDNFAHGTKIYNWVNNEEEALNKISEATTKNGWVLKSIEKSGVIFTKGEYRLHANINSTKDKEIIIDIVYMR